MSKEKVTFDSGGRELHGTLLASDEPTGAAVLFMHGYKANGSTLRQYARPLAREGATCLTFDLSGHGLSGGMLEHLNVEDHVHDAIAAFDLLKAQGTVDPERIGALGMSYGGYLATLLSSRRNVRSLLLRAPPLYPNELRHRPRHTYTDHDALEAVPDPDNPALKGLQAFGGTVALVAMEHDLVVPARVTDAYRAARPDIAYSVMPAAGHSLDATTKPLFQEVAVEWAADL
ncbi:MAG TPA: alpha/beta fold hydrolase [Verrucomicrobiae bacterium]|nr:alpha/beta fold hydrolase [Verrucomicrobiae bacterium]